MFNNLINCTCAEEFAYDKYVTYSLGNADSDAEIFIEADTKSKKRTYNPFDVIEDIVEKYLHIGYLKNCNQDYVSLSVEFIYSYGIPEGDKNTLSVNDFAEEAELLYLHLKEICTKPYPDDPEWILDPTPASPVPTVKDGKNIILWQTKNLANAIELGYTLMLASDINLNICKHCQKPYIAKNPKQEFCGLKCRNSYNVRKYRAK